MSFQCYGYAASPNYKNQKLPMPAALLMFAGAGTVIHYNDKRRAIPKGSSQGTENERNAVKGPAIGGPFKLIDMNYNEVTDRDLRGNWVLMYFGYTSSPDVGPQELQKMAEAIDIIGQDPFFFAWLLFYHLCEGSEARPDQSSREGDT
ncbi:hypothetical protein ACLOJK_013283 [Asimina triloba]